MSDRRRDERLAGWSAPVFRRYPGSGRQETSAAKALPSRLRYKCSRAAVERASAKPASQALAPTVRAATARPPSCRRPPEVDTECVAVQIAHNRLIPAVIRGERLQHDCPAQRAGFV